MNNPSEKFIPRWARNHGSEYDSLALMPNCGIQPPFKPKFFTRLLPTDGSYLISAKTLVDTASITQRILQYVGHDLAYGSNAAFTDLRTVGKEVLYLSNMKIEPFEEGSFVIPATLSEDTLEVNGKKLSGHDVLERFYEVLETLSGNGNTSVISLGLIQSIIDLGRVVRREAVIEYSPSEAFGYSEKKPYVVNENFVKHTSKVRSGLIDHNIIPDSLVGRLTALDINKSSLSLTTKDKTTVRGSFEFLMQPTLVECMNEWVEVWGVVEYVSEEPTFIRVFTVEKYDEAPQNTELP